MIFTPTRFAFQRLTADLSRASSESLTRLPIRLASTRILPNGLLTSQASSTQEIRFSVGTILNTRAYATASPAKTRSTGRKKTTSTKKPAPKKKPKTKAKAKPKPKKRILTEKGKAAKAKKEATAKLKALKATALLDAPKRMPYSVWALLIKEQAEKGPASVEKYSKDAAEKYKSLSLQEMEVNAKSTSTEARIADVFAAL